MIERYEKGGGHLAIPFSCSSLQNYAVLAGDNECRCYFLDRVVLVPET